MDQLGEGERHRSYVQRIKTVCDKIALQLYSVNMHSSSLTEVEQQKHVSTMHNLSQLLFITPPWPLQSRLRSRHQVDLLTGSFPGFTSLFHVCVKSDQFVKLIDLQHGVEVFTKVKHF